MGSGYRDSRDIWVKIEGARRLWSILRGELEADTAFIDALGKYRKEIESSFRLMIELGVGSQCAACSDERIQGGCCSREIEEWYDETLLLLNIALGVQLPGQRVGEEGCLFLGPRGCLLIARHNFCVNYLCPRLQFFLDEEGLRRLKSQYGRELAWGWECELMIMRRAEGWDNMDPCDSQGRKFHV